MPGSTIKAKREVAEALAVPRGRSKTPSRRPPTTGNKKATTPKRGTPSKRQAAEVIAEEDPASPLVSPSKRVRTPTSNRYPEKEVVVVDDKDDVPLGRMTRLFPEDETLAKSHDKDTDKDNDKKEEAAAAPSALFSTPQKPKKEGSGKFLGTPGSIQCSPSVKNAYSIVRRCTGSLGGNGSGGAIYGELTTGSMQKVVDVMIEHCKLGKDSIFIDVGAGLGKPNIHVAQYPGVAASYGIEHEQVRWQLSLHNLKHLLQAAESDAREAQVAAEEKEEAKEGDAEKEKEKEKEVVEEDQGKINHKIFFHYGDITEARTLDPFTHVYMFDIGFPPTLFYEIADRFNASRSPYLICYHGPKLIAERYGFNVELLHQIPTSMHGSSEGHQAYFYKRADSKPTKPKSASKGKGKAKGGKAKSPATAAATTGSGAAPCDALFKDGLDLIRHGSLESLHGWVKNQMDNHFMSPRPARRRRSTNLFLNEI